MEDWGNRTHTLIAGVGIALASLMVSSAAIGVGPFADEGDESQTLTPAELKDAQERMQANADLCSVLFDQNLSDQTLIDLQLPTEIGITSSRVGFRCISDNKAQTVAIAFFAAASDQPADIVSNDIAIAREMRDELARRGVQSRPARPGRSAADSVQLTDALAKAVNR